MTFGNNLALAVGDNGTILASTNLGLTWTLDDTQGSTANLLDVVHHQPEHRRRFGGRGPPEGERRCGCGCSRGTGLFFTTGEEVVDVPFGHEWLLVLLIFTSALYCLRKQG